MRDFTHLWLLTVFRTLWLFLTSTHFTRSVSRAPIFTLVSVVLCVGAAVNQLHTVSPVALPSTSGNFGQVWCEKGTKEDLTMSKPCYVSPVEKPNKYTDRLDTCCIFHSEMHKPDRHLFTLKVCCRLSALQLLSKGHLRTLKHVKISSSADAGLLPAAPSTNSIFSLKKNERMTSWSVSFGKVCGRWTLSYPLPSHVLMSFNWCNAGEGLPGGGGVPLQLSTGGLEGAFTCKQNQTASTHF